MSDLEKYEKLYEEYNREDRYWKIIYYRYELFWSQYNACVAWLLANPGVKPEVDSLPFISKPAPLREPSDEIKEQVKKRDGFRCLCCGTKHKLEIDHINPKYHGGDHSLDNLQTLCNICNQKKDTEEIDFRNNKTPLTVQPDILPLLELPKTKQANDVEQWELFLHRSVNFLYRCNAVKSINNNVYGGVTHSWEICLYADNKARWLKQHLEVLKDRIKLRLEEAKFYGRVTITIQAPNCDVI